MVSVLVLFLELPLSSFDGYLVLIKTNKQTNNKNNRLLQFITLFFFILCPMVTFPIRSNAHPCEQTFLNDSKSRCSAAQGAVSNEGQAMHVKRCVRRKHCQQTEHRSQIPQSHQIPRHNVEAGITCQPGVPRTVEICKHDVANVTRGQQIVRSEDGDTLWMRGGGGERRAG